MICLRSHFSHFWSSHSHLSQFDILFSIEVRSLSPRLWMTPTLLVIVFSIIWRKSHLDFSLLIKEFGEIPSPCIKLTSFLPEVLQRSNLCHNCYLLLKNCNVSKEEAASPRGPTTFSFLFCSALFFSLLFFFHLSFFSLSFSLSSFLPFFFPFSLPPFLSFLSFSVKANWKLTKIRLETSPVLVKGMSRIVPPSCSALSCVREKDAILKQI